MESPDDGLSLRRFILPGLFVLALFVVLIARRGPAPDDLNAHSVAGEAMGTTWNVAWVPDGEGGGQDDVRAAASAAIEQVNASMSTYLASSELSRFNDRRDDQPVALGPGLGEVLVEAQRKLVWSLAVWLKCFRHQLSCHAVRLVLLIPATH